MEQDKNLIKKVDFLKAISDVLKETFEGSPESGSMYLDRGVGVFNSLEKVTAELASRSISWEGASVAAHAEHARFYLQMLCEFMNGRTEKVDWNESWRVKTVDEKEWQALKENLQKEYQSTIDTFEKIENWDEDAIGGAMGIVAHTAYHLGSIRQIIKTF